MVKMNKKIIFIAIIVGIALLSLAALMLAGIINKKNIFPARQGNSEVLTQNVRVTANFFQPDALLLKAGTTVVWKNEDSQPHQVQFQSFASKEIAPGKSFSRKFDAPGVYDYFCPLHPEKKARIVVQ